MLKVVKNQEYQTREEIRAAAIESESAAIRSSVRHWRELATAPVKDLISNGNPGFTVAECALCERYRGICTRCPLYVKLGDEKCYVSGGLYHKAFRIIENIQIGDLDYTKAYHDKQIKRFRRIAEKLMKVLESCLED